jgi:hypothetical protein
VKYLIASDPVIAPDSRKFYTILNRRVIGNMFDFNTSSIPGSEIDGR